MPTPLATLIVPSRAPRSGASVTQERQERRQERDASAWAFTWALLTGWELPDVPDELGTLPQRRQEGQHRNEPARC